MTKRERRYHLLKVIYKLMKSNNFKRVINISYKPEASEDLNLLRERMGLEGSEEFTRHACFYPLPILETLIENMVKEISSQGN